ncbi:MAG: MurR/RpiR family transcriptional regulator, partial [Escherichia coli]
MPENENLLLRLRQSVDGYSRTQQKLGEFVLSDPAKVVYLTSSELAREIGTSEAIDTRLCRARGC